MTEHSKHQLKGSSLDKDGENSVAVLQDKLQFSQMSMGLDTQVFEAKRSEVKEIIRGLCDLPEQVCNSMVAAASASDTKYHKKRSVPLDDNTGKYIAVWMWIKPSDSDHESVQVAFKSSSLSYRLRDVVTYREQIEEEPDVRCVKVSESGFWSTSHREECTQFGVRKTVTPIPVFKQAVMNPQEMALVDTMMERMLAQKVLENKKGEVPGIAPTDSDHADPSPGDEL